MVLLFVYLIGAMLFTFLCSVLETVLMATPLSDVTMKEQEGYAPAIRFKKYKTDPSRAIAAILTLNTIAATVGASGVGHQTAEAFGAQWFGVVSAVTTVLMLIFSEIIPKTIGASYWKNLIGFTTVTLNIIIIETLLGSEIVNEIDITDDMQAYARERFQQRVLAAKASAREKEAAKPKPRKPKSLRKNRRQPFAREAIREDIRRLSQNFLLSL